MSEPGLGREPRRPEVAAREDEQPRFPGTPRLGKCVSLQPPFRATPREGPVPAA
jgi:hypothetical protein